MDDISIWLLLFAVLFGGVVGWVLCRPAGQNNTQLQDKMDNIARQQTELQGRITGFAETQEKARGELNRTLNERLDNVSQSVTQSLKDTGEKTHKTLSNLGERLATIDKAQQEITSLSGQFVELQQILDNKQARGAFGEVQLTSIVTDFLPASAYALQHTLSNKKRVDCLIRLPNPPGPVAVDSKFPLEAYRALRQAKNEAEEKSALSQMKTDILKHARDIEEKYIVAGETADFAFMFLPSESIFAELESRLPEAVEECRQRRVYPVSPNTMALGLNTVRAFMRDVKMREQAGLIQKEVGLLLKDVGRLNDRVGKLRSHFNLADRDIRDIETSSDKIGNRSEKITELDIEQDEKPNLLES
ncbi:MAG: DNA recombination protein RmuC [Alphaproteobacteria bacterium]|nr:DNA recombination protein RmuC [Alphaproteobacteria bacterium]